MNSLPSCLRRSMSLASPCMRRLTTISHQTPRTLLPPPSTTSTATIPAFLLPSFARRARPIPIQPPNLPSTLPPHHRQKRTFSHTPSPHAVVVTANPRKDADGNDMIVDITPRAAQRLREIQQQDDKPSLALRVSVQSGGCHGFQYLMSLTDTIHANHDAPSNPSEASPPPPPAGEEEEEEGAQDTIFEESSADAEGSAKARVIMDEPSLELLKGSSVDYTMELIGSQFKIVGNPAATSSCGCGTSFDIKA